VRGATLGGWWLATAPRPELGGVLLTGGASRRLGSDKATARLADGRTLAQHGAATLRSVCLHCIEVGPGVSGLTTVCEQPPGAGPLAAVLAGAAALGRAGVLVLAVDLPRVGPDVLHTLAATPGPAAIARADGRLQYVCACYGAEVLARATAAFAAGERGFRWLGPDDFVPVDFSAELFVDLDTPADAAALGVELRP
jgi:molybdopterin-guanine dinucleotide biosynthesis protein A